MEMATELARLASATERLLEHHERREQREQDRQLAADWPDPPAHMGLSTYLTAIPGLAARFDRAVPDEFVARIDDERYEIACPCGESPTVEPGQLGSCTCGRWFLHDGHTIHAALSPKAEA